MTPVDCVSFDRDVAEDRSVEIGRETVAGRMSHADSAYGAQKLREIWRGG